MQSIHLPFHSSHLTAVQQAVNNLAHVGKVVIKPYEEGAETAFGQCGTFKWAVMDVREYERTQADAIEFAAERISPARVCYIETLLHSPLILRWVRTDGS
jgi:hypothetical protein